MKNKWVLLIWGIIFLGIGAALLAGYNWNQLTRPIHLTVFAVAGVAFFISYYLQGVRSWGWLFPALFCTATALSIGVELTGVDSEGVTNYAYIVTMTAPLYVGYAVNRKHWGLLVPANVLVAFTVASSIFPYFNGNFLAAAIIYATGLPFLVVYLFKRSRTWALITTLIIAVGGTIPLMDALFNYDSQVTGAVFLFLVALCFTVPALLSKKNWWAIIPAGLFASLGVDVVVELVVPHTEFPQYPYMVTFDKYIWVLFLGMAATFGIVWLQRKTQPTAWAVYPAVGLAVVAVLSFAEGILFQKYWLATLLMVTGTMLLIALVANKGLPWRHQPPHLKA